MTSAASLESWGFRTRLGAHVLEVPVLAGLPFGHDPDPKVATLGVPCTLDADAGMLTLAAALEQEISQRQDR